MRLNNRLFEIVYILMQKRKITAKELADRFEVSTRTIYRDIETLSTANIPIYASKGKDGGIGLLDEFVLNKALLSEEEQSQILFALQGMMQVKRQDERDILEKLSILFNKKFELNALPNNAIIKDIDLLGNFGISFFSSSKNIFIPFRIDLLAK